MKKMAWKRLLACVLVAVLLLPAGVHAAATDVEVSVTVPHTQTDSNRTNYFVFASNQWAAGNETHTWSNTPSAANPSDTYYEVCFTGHKIDVYAGKNSPMGKVRYIIDDETVGVYSLYRSSNIDEELIATFDGLEEGPHTFRAEATGEKDSAATGTLIDCAKVVVYSYRSMSEPLYGAIVDDDLQYVQADIESAFAMDAQSQTLNAWRNDTAVSQIFLAAGGSDLHNLTATAGSFSDGNGHTIPAGQVTLSFIQTVQAYTGMPGWATSTNHPAVPTGSRAEAAEVLMGNTVDTLESGHVKGLWVSIDVPKDAEPGTYQGAVTVTADGLTDAQKLTFRYTLTVAAEVLPDATEFKDGFDIELWQNPYASAEYYDVEPFSAKHFEILTPIMEKYKSIGGHAITTTIVDEAWSGQTYSKNNVHFPSMVKWTKTSAGAWSFDYTQLDAWITFNKETIGIGDKIVCYSIAPWTNAIPYYDQASGQTASISSSDSTQWNTAWTTFLTSLMVHMEEKGWKDETYIGIDERGFSNAAFDLIDSVTGTDGEPFKTAGAMDHFVDNKALAMRVDDLNVGSTAVKGHPTDFATLVADREAQGLRTTVYSCTGHAPGNFSLSAPGESYWTMMYSYSVGGAGFMRWSYDSWVEDPLRDTTHCYFEAGDCFSIFPDEKDAAHPVAHSSLRLEKMAQGVRDVNKLITIKESCPLMESAVDALMATVKPTYATSGYYLTAAAKETLAADMKTLREGIVSLTEEYEDRLATGDTKPLEIQYTIPQIVLPEKYQGDVEGPDVKDGPRQYLGQPDMIMLKDGNTLVTSFPIGHGCGALVLKKSEDRGETWEEITDTPTSWTRSLETPTMYRLNMTDGSTKYVLIAGRPHWDYNQGDDATGGWDVSTSDDGIHWSEYTQYHGDSGIFTTVAMASLVQLKENGAYIDKWMGVFHDGVSFVNYKTYLTFDADGNMQWSAPEPYLTKYRAIESQRQICEVGMFRSPDGNRIMAMGRAQSHAHKSVMFWSDDEGETWSKPVDMQGALQGERHKALYDPISGRLLITFREIILDYNQNGQIEDGDWRAGDWIAWVGTYQDLMERNEGEYRIMLDEDWANNTYSGDTGYTGMAVYPDGTFVLDSYGHWDKEFSQNMGYGVRVDRCWIRWAKFKLTEIDDLYDDALAAILDEIPANVLAKNAKANSKQTPTSNTATDGGPAWAFDDQNHWWHSRYSEGVAETGDATSGTPSADNHIWIQTGFDAARYIKELTYQPRPSNGCAIKDYEVQLACLDNPTATPTDDDFVTVKKGTLGYTPNSAQTITLDKAYKATHIRLVAVGPVQDTNSYASAKRIRIWAARVGELLPPDEITITGEGVVGSEATLITNVEAKKTLQLNATAFPEDRNQGVKWSSTNPQFATVDENGLVTAVANGTTAIKATSAAITEDSGVKPAEANYTIHVVTRIENITVKKDGEPIGDDPIKVYVKVKETDTAHPNSVTLTTETDPVEVPHPERNWVQVDGKEGMISIVASGTNSATATIAANGTELDVGEVTVRVESAEHPEVYTDFTVQVIRYLDHDIYITGDAKVGSTLTASTVNLVMTDEAKAHLSYQWYRDSVSEGNKIAGATGRQYTVTEADKGKVLFVTATADPATFYEGTRTAETKAPVAKADGPAAPTGLTAVNCTDGNDGRITGLDADTVYQYKLADAVTWTPVTAGATTVDNLPAGNYQVRIAATDTQEAGKAATVTVMAADVTAYTITVAPEVEGGVIEISASQAVEGTKITVTVTPNAGYELVEDSLTVTYTDGEEKTETVTDGKFSMPAANVTITAQFAKKTFTITHDMENVTCSLPGEDVHTVEYGDKPNIKLTAKDGYTMPGNMQVTYEVENGVPQPFYGYEYSRSATDPDTATLKFTDGITANLTVTATIPEKTFTVDYTLKNGLTAPTKNAPRTVGYKAAYTGKLVAEDPTKYTLPLGITATMDGESFADFTYDSETGVITIAADKITGDLVITASGVDARVPVKPVTGVEVQKTLALQVGKSQTLTATVQPSDATLKDVVWESADTKIATVDEDGKVTGVAVGETKITVTTVDGHRTATCTVTVTKPASTSKPTTTTTTETKPDGTTVTTETKPDGTKVETVKEPDGTTAVTETKKDGTVTEKVETPDGTKSETETKPDGTVTEKVEEPDGTKAVTETKPDGSKTATVEQADGTKSETVVTPEGDATITVTDAEGEELVKTEIPATIPEPETKFEDISVTPWAEEAINKVAGLELVKGVGGNKYDPVTPMTRGALATVLHRLSNGKTDYQVAFKDVQSNKYYTEGVAWAAKVNVVKGISEDIFAPDQIITREQLAVMLARYAKLIGMSTKADTKSLEQFADGGNTGAWAVDGMAWCVEKGILKGKGLNNLDPTADVSRAEVAVMLDRFIALIQK